VPDIKPDARSIMQEKGNVVIEEMHMHEGELEIRGALYFTVLYAGEDEIPVCDLAGNTPFFETVKMDCEGVREEEISIQANIEDFRADLINSRKLGIRAVIVFSVAAETIYDGEGAVDIVEENDVFTKKKTMDVTKLILAKKDTLRVRDECRLPGTKDTIGRILYDDVTLDELDTRCEEDKMIVTGEIGVFVLYLNTEEPAGLGYHECHVPVQGEIPCGGCDETSVLQVRSHIHSYEMEVKQDEDGEDRILDVEAVIAFSISAYGQEQLELLTDFYSTSKVCKPIYEMSYFENLLLKNKSKSRVDGKILLDEGKQPLQIWKVSGEARVDDKRIGKDSVVVEGILDINILYQSSDVQTPLAASKGMLPFEQEVQIPGVGKDSDIRLEVSVEQISGTLLGENEADIKAVLVLDVLAFENHEEPIISGVEEQEMDLATRAKEPGMVGYVVKPGEELWDVAKKFYTTKEAIVEINQLEEETLMPGQIVLVMKEMGQAG
ncbi:MAG: SPOCS domain-containing protein, partial [Eubacterium sp.]